MAEKPKMMAKKKSFQQGSLPIKSQRLDFLHIERYQQPQEKTLCDRRPSQKEKVHFLGGKPQQLGETPLRLGQKLQTLIRLSLGAGL